MNSAAWKKGKWLMLVALAAIALMICTGWTHGSHEARGAYEGIGRQSGSFLHGGAVTGRAGHEEHGSLGFAAALIKIGALLLGTALFAKGRSIVKWIGGLVAVAALCSLASFWLLAIAAIIVVAYICMRRVGKGRTGPERASADWLAAAPSHDQGHILDQWEEQLNKEAKQ